MQLKASRKKENKKNSKIHDTFDDLSIGLYLPISSELCIESLDLNEKL